MKIEDKSLVNAWEAISKREYQNAINNALKTEQSGYESFLTYYILGLAHFNLEHYKESKIVIEKGLIKYPDQTDLLAVLAGCLIKENKYEEALLTLEKSLNINNNNSLAWSHLSWLYYNKQNHTMSLFAARKSLELQPNDFGARCNLASSLKEMGKVDEAIEEYKKIITECPDLRNGWLGYLFTSLFSENFDAGDHLIMAKKFSKLLRKNKHAEFHIEKNQNSKIILGILSEDIRTHACAYFLIPFVANLNREIVEVKIFCLNLHKDNISNKIKKIADEFIDLSELDEASIIQKVRSEKLDLLIDLGGHTGNSPLRYMAHRLAPVQGSWLGYPATTGMDEIEFKITDVFADSKSNFSNYTEKLIFSPDLFCVYSPLVATPLRAYEEKYKVTEAPCIRNGFVTFGSCNNLAKLTNKTIEMWSEILRNVPNSRLLVEAANLANGEVLQHIKSRFKSSKIDCSRVDFLQRDEKNQYLTYNKIDIILDTSPLTGGTTTCDALWMGVPVITLAGINFHERMSGALLSSIGFDSFITHNKDEYIVAAINLSKDYFFINEIRSSLRQKFENSNIMNANKFCKWFVEQASALTGKSINRHQDSEEKIYFSGNYFSLTDLHNISSVLIADGKFKEAKNLLENMSTKWPRHWIVANALAEIDLKNGNINEAIYKFQDALLLADSVNLKKYFNSKLMELKT